MSDCSTKMAIELAKNKWVVRVSRPRGGRESVYQYTNDLKVVKFKEMVEVVLGEGYPVFSCYEAGRDGFWLHRWLTEKGVTNFVIAPQTMERKPGKKRKTDRIDTKKMMKAMIKYLDGDKDAWSVVYVPSREDEARRELIRHLKTLEKDVQRHNNRMLGKLAQYGIDGLKGHAPSAVWENLSKLMRSHETGDGSKIPDELIFVIKQGAKYLASLEELRDEAERKVNQRVQRDREDAEKLGVVDPVTKLERYKGIGKKGATMLTWELCQWGRFPTGKKVGKFFGLTSTPIASGNTFREGGIDKEGSGRLRWLGVELAWLWVRHQPQSDLVKKWSARLAHKGRIRRMAIVGLTRQLMVRLWLYVIKDVEIPGAVFS